MITLGIETSCDETSCAIIDDSRLLSNKVSSSVHLHSKYGGVVPEIASRCHIEYIDGVLKEALKEAKIRLNDIELIALTCGPGLCGSLLTGISYAKALSFALSKPFIGVNHIIAHMHSNFIKTDAAARGPHYPYIGLVISGGHTNIYKAAALDEYELIGCSQDDAAGEAFDKVAKIMGLGYPGGPVIERRADAFRGKDDIHFPRAYLEKDSFDFSFSGLKTAVLYYYKKHKRSKTLIDKISYAFQEAVFDVVRDKTIAACRKFGIREIAVGGGVACNSRFRETLLSQAREKNIDVFIPDKSLCLDNGAMIACFGEDLFKKGKRSDVLLTAEPNMPACWQERRSSYAGVL